MSCKDKSAPPMIYRVPVAQTIAPPGVEIQLPRPAKGILVHSGAPGVRIFLGSSSESFVGERSIDAATGICLARDFDRVFVKGTNAAEQTDVIFEGLDCCPAQIASIGRSHVVFERVFNDFAIAGFDPTPTRATLISSASFDNLAVNDNRVQPVDGWWLGGAILANVTFTLRLWARINATKRALVGSLQFPNADPDLNFGGSLDTGWRKDLAVSGTFQPLPIPLTLPWELEIFQPSGFAMTVNGTLFLRDVA